MLSNNNFACVRDCWLTNVFGIHGQSLANSFLYLVEDANSIVVLVRLGLFESWLFVSGSKLRDMVNQSALVLLSLPFFL